MKNYGTTKTVVGVHNNYAANFEDRLTYLEAPSSLKEIWIAKNPVSGQKELQDRTLLEIPYDNSETHDDVYVFDDLVVTKIK